MNRKYSYKRIYKYFETERKILNKADIKVKKRKSQKMSNNVAKTQVGNMLIHLAVMSPKVILSTRKQADGIMKLFLPKV